MPRKRSLITALATLILAVALGACGSSGSSGTSADPATLIPAAVPLYAGATVRPEGSQKSTALAAGRALTSQSDPYARLLLALQTPGSPALVYSHDVAPWLGPHAGIFLTSAGSFPALLSLLEKALSSSQSASGTSAFPFASGAGAPGAQGAIVLDTSDTGKASSFLSAQEQHAAAHATSYRGVNYQVGSGGVAFALIDRFVVIGSESGLHAVIGTKLGSAALVHAGAYSQLLAGAPSGALAHIYANPAAASAAGAGSEATGLLQLLTGGRVANVSVVPSGSSIAIDADTLAGSGAGARASGGVLTSGAAGGQALGELPGESWLALGLGHVRETIGEDVAVLRALTTLGSSGSSGPPSPATSLSLSSIVGGLLTPLAALAANTAEARGAFQSWMGSAGIYASGSSLLELKGAVVIESTNASLSRAAVARLGAQLSRAGDSVSPVSIAGTEAALAVRVNGLPVMLDIAAGRDSNGHTKFVLGLGEASVTAALNPPSRLAGSSALSAASSALGEGTQPNLLFTVPTLLGLLEGLGLNEDPTIARFVPYLRNVTTLDGGGRSLGGGVQRVRLVLGLRG